MDKTTAIVLVTCAIAAVSIVVASLYFSRRKGTSDGRVAPQDLVDAHMVEMQRINDDLFIAIEANAGKRRAVELDAVAEFHAEERAADADADAAIDGARARAQKGKASDVVESINSTVAGLRKYLGGS